MHSVTHAFTTQHNSQSQFGKVGKVSQENVFGDTLKGDLLCFVLFSFVYIALTLNMTTNLEEVKQSFDPRSQAWDCSSALFVILSGLKMLELTNLQTSIMDTVGPHVANSGGKKQTKPTQRCQILLVDTLCWL